MIPTTSRSLSDEISPAPGKSASKANVAAVGDAAALFRDEPKSSRKLQGAEARAQARRCSSCSSIVPAGMSLCSRCGLDLDTGQRIEPIDIYEDEAPVIHRSETPPIGVMVVGSFCSFGFLLLSMISLVQWGRGAQGSQFLLVIWLFGLFGGIQFLRLKSVRPIFLALSLAVMVGAVYLIAMPIFYANMPPEVAPESVSLTETVVEDFDAPQIRSITESLDLNRISWGVGSLISYAVVAVYLNSSKPSPPLQALIVDSESNLNSFIDGSDVGRKLSRFDRHFFPLVKPETLCRDDHGRRP